MLLKSVFVFCLCTSLSYGTLYDYYSAEILSDDLLAFYEENNITDTCAIDIQPCNETERRRVDGSCNNLNNPSRSTYFQPMPRLLPAQFYNGYMQRKAVSGNELTLARVVRTHLLKDGKSSHLKLNHNVPGVAGIVFADIGSVHDFQNLVFTHTRCCEPEHMNDYACTPNFIPENDFMHRYTGIRCMNSTRPLTYQDYNCTTDPVPSPIAQATPVLDLSFIYNAFNKGDKVIRSFEGGKLIVEEEDGKLFPPNGPTAICPGNKVNENETRCFENHPNTLLAVSMFSVWYVRFHNYLATQLAAINTCWDDETLFYAARDICIASYQQMYLHELLPALVGYDNLVKAGIIIEDGGFRDDYDETKYPEVTLEYSLSMRWFHLLQEGTLKFFDKNGNFIKNYQEINLVFRAGFLAKDNNMEYLTQSTFRAPCHNADHSVDFDVAEVGFPDVQLSIDAPAGDLNKCRNFGLPPYIDYLNLFTGRNITSFDDLIEFMSEEKIYLLKDVYEDVADIDLIAGMWIENYIEGGDVPLTLAHILMDTTLRQIQGDRHWYERPNRPYAFTEDQLKEIRMSSLSMLLCIVGDGVTEVPENAFYNISPENPLVSCSDIHQLDLSAWADDTCSSSSS